MNYLVLMRHGQSAWNLENRFTGFTDVGLTDMGRKEAERAGKHLEKIRFDRIFCSTLSRAITTAEISLAASGQSNAHLAANGSFAMTCHDDLRERDYGDLTGLNKDETREKYGADQVHIWRRSYDTPPPGGESLKDVVARVQPYYEEHMKPEIDAGKNVLLAAHGNTLRAMLIVLGIKTPDNINEMEVPTGIPLIIAFENGKMQSWHLLDDNAPAQNSA
ncbi:MAG: 2,3-bisphosphoglycerate-dependent phosphoglycerate mutase [Pseudomonadota bacterium]|nr:2,3-bisphosphoglycerate-dependent phosphoglycerate mutase [Pseudomonadota bacterium]QKK04997.1 MAG: 2,3-bisphosphoglycerate-dependent phosphoglycerate mutase [Pseudomonadota bacterium]